jgi:hypothetical protein
MWADICIVRDALLAIKQPPAILLRTGSSERTLHLSFTALTERKLDCTWSGSSVHSHVLSWQLCFTLISCLAYSSTLKIEETWSPETSVDFQLPARCYIPVDKNSSELVALPLRIRNFPSSNFYLETSSPDWGAPSGEDWDSTRLYAKVSSFRILGSSFFIVILPFEAIHSVV